MISKCCQKCTVQHFLEQDISKLLSLACKQKLWGFPWRRKFWFENFTKSCLKWSGKRWIRSANHNSQITNLKTIDDVVFCKITKNFPERDIIISWHSLVLFQHQLQRYIWTHLKAIFSDLQMKIEKTRENTRMYSKYQNLTVFTKKKVIYVKKKKSPQQ